MAKAYLNSYAAADAGRPGGAAQCFGGVCSQPRVLVNTAAAYAWPAEAPLTVEDATAFVEVVNMADAVIYAGPSVNPAVWETHGIVRPAGVWPIYVAMGDKVAVRDLNPAA